MTQLCRFHKTQNLDQLDQRAGPVTQPSAHLHKVATPPKGWKAAGDLKQPSEWRYIGKGMTSVDLALLCTGKAMSA